MTTRKRLSESTRSKTAINETEEEDLEIIEEEVKEMVNKVKEYRSTLPFYLHSTFTSLLTSLRPSISLSSDVSLAEPSSRPHLLPGEESSSGTSSTKDLAAGDTEKTADDVKLLHDKISNNISAMPKLVKRMNDVISRIDKLTSSDDAIHPAFKKKKS